MPHPCKIRQGSTICRWMHQSLRKIPKQVTWRMTPVIPLFINEITQGRLCKVSSMTLLIIVNILSVRTFLYRCVGCALCKGTVSKGMQFPVQTSCICVYYNNFPGSESKISCFDKLVKYGCGSSVVGKGQHSLIVTKVPQRLVVLWRVYMNQAFFKVLY